MTTACSCLPDQISCVLKVPTRVRHQYRLKSEKSNRRKFKLTSVDVVGRSSGVRGVLGEKEDTGSGLFVDLRKTKKVSESQLPTSQHRKIANIESVPLRNDREEPPCIGCP